MLRALLSSSVLFAVVVLFSLATLIRSNRLLLSSEQQDEGGLAPGGMRPRRMMVHTCAWVGGEHKHGNPDRPAIHRGRPHPSNTTSNPSNPHFTYKHT